MRHHIIFFLILSFTKQKILHTITNKTVEKKFEQNQKHTSFNNYTIHTKKNTNDKKMAYIKNTEKIIKKKKIIHVQIQNNKNKKKSIHYKKNQINTQEK